MRIRQRHFIVSGQHRRFQRLWQFFFTGWGLVMVCALVAAPFFTKNLLWQPISAIDMKGIVSNQFKMENASFAGLDKNGEPFEIKAKNVHQEHKDENIVYLETVNGKIVRVMDGQKITDNISANRAVYNKEKKKMTMRGSVSVDSSNGDKLRTNEMVIQL